MKRLLSLSHIFVVYNFFGASLLCNSDLYLGVLNWSWLSCMRLGILFLPQSLAMNAFKQSITASLQTCPKFMQHSKCTVWSYITFSIGKCCSWTWTQTWPSYFPFILISTSYSFHLYSIVSTTVWFLHLLYPFCRCSSYITKFLRFQFYSLL
jgi:hypothetical protein